MINPDQIYTVRQLQHHDLRAEAAAYHMERECAQERAAARRAWLARWLRRLSMRRTHAGTLSSRTGMKHLCIWHSQAAQRYSRVAR